MPEIFLANKDKIEKSHIPKRLGLLYTPEILGCVGKFKIVKNSDNSSNDTNIVNRYLERLLKSTFSIKYKIPTGHKKINAKIEI